MRLTCPNCDAQYEVPADVIPEGGRDVQCSNCGHTWFQMHPDDEVMAEPEPEITDTPDWDPEPETEPEDDYEPEEEAAAPVRRGLDPSVADVLREEAELETRRRAEEAGGLESQPDLGLMDPDEDDLSRRQRQARERMRRIRGESAAEEYSQPPVVEAAATAAASEALASATSRRDLLPDIDEINSTLRASDDRQPGETPQGSPVEEEDVPSGGFFRGFAYVVLLFAIGALAYVFAPQIKESIPQVAPTLDAYVDKVDVGRVWLNDQIAMLLQKLDGLSSEATPAPEAEPAQTPEN